MKKIPNLLILPTLIACMALSLLGSGAGPATAPADKAETEQHVAALVKSLKQSQANLKQYEWIETTVISVKDEEKARKLNRCYHGEDGKLQKVPIATGDEEKKKPRGIRGKIAEQKKEEMTDYMKQVLGLVHTYVPPDPAALRKAKEAGKASVHLLDPGKRVRLDFREYQLPDDLFSVEIDLTTDRILSARITSHVSAADDPLTCDARFAALKDGTTYPAQVTLDVKEKKMKVTVENSGYRKLGD